MEANDVPMLRPRPIEALAAADRFAGLDASVGEFWSWAFSDLRENTTRGVLAEFLVARAVGDPTRVRLNWLNHDVVTPDGVTIEVKSSAFLQSWSQRIHSKPIFGRLKARVYDMDRNVYGQEQEVRADVFVFAVQTQLEPDAYDMLNVSHWQFWVASAETIRTKAGKSVSMAWVSAHATGPVVYAELAAEIAKHAA